MKETSPMKRLTLHPSAFLWLLFVFLFGFVGQTSAQYLDGEYIGGEYVEPIGGEYLGGGYSGEYMGGEYISGNPYEYGGEYIYGDYIGGGYYEPGEYLGGEYLYGEYPGEYMDGEYLYGEYPGEYMGGEYIYGEYLGGEYMDEPPYGEFMGGEYSDVYSPEYFYSYDYGAPSPTYTSMCPSCGYYQPYTSYYYPPAFSPAYSFAPAPVYVPPYSASYRQGAPFVVSPHVSTAYPQGQGSVVVNNVNTNRNTNTNYNNVSAVAMAVSAAPYVSATLPVPPATPMSYSLPQLPAYTSQPVVQTAAPYVSLTQIPYTGITLPEYFIPLVSFIGALSILFTFNYAYPQQMRSIIVEPFRAFVVDAYRIWIGY